MNRILISSAAALVFTLAQPAMADDYSVFKVCQDTRVLHTADGADAGHVEYLVVDPADRHIVSTVVSGGVLGDRFVALPYDDLNFEGNTIVLRDIDRERLIAAPVFERTQIVEGGRLSASYFERSSTYFGGRGRDAGARGQGEVRAQVTGGAAVGENRAVAPGTTRENGRAADAATARENASREEASRRTGAPEENRAAQGTRATREANSEGAVSARQGGRNAEAEASHDPKRASEGSRGTRTIATDVPRESSPSESAREGNRPPGTTTRESTHGAGEATRKTEETTRGAGEATRKSEETTRGAGETAHSRTNSTREGTGAHEGARPQDRTNQ